MPRKYLLTLAASVVIVFTAACAMRLPVIHPVNQPPGASLILPSLPPPQIPDPPSRVVRISYLRGAVSFQASGTETWSRAELNRPVAEGDALWTDGGARAELHLGSAAIRMDSRTRLDFLKFNDRTVQARVILGVVGVTVRRLEPGEALEVDTPNAAVTFLRPGQYRLDVEPAMDSTFVTVRTGDAEVSGTRLDFTVHTGQRANVSGPEAVEWGLASEPASDKFDKLCDMRDRREDTSASAQYVAPDTIGHYDLDEFGVWRVDAKWGAVWTPRGLATGWAPYRFGHWTWVELWGWTWIDDAAWGFAPFHYGRWIFLDGAWSWIPGPPHVRPIYAPALVVFVGGGGHGFHYFYWIGSAGVAWIPIGPGEVYVPPYRCSPSYLTNINITNTAIEDQSAIERINLAHQSYANRSVAGAMTAVPREVFVQGQPIAHAAVSISRRQASLAQVNGAVPPVAPVEESLSPRRDRFVLPPPEVPPGQTVVGRRDPAPRPVPFRQRQGVLEAHPGRPLEQSEVESLRNAASEPERSDVRPARLGSLERESIAPPTPARTPEEVAREQNSEAQRLWAIRYEMRRAQRAANR